MTDSLPTASKRCTTCQSLLPAGAFNRRGKSPDGRASICRRCAGLKRSARTKPRETNAMRAAIKRGDFDGFQKLFPAGQFQPGRLLAFAAQNYSTAPKHAGHTQIAEYLIAHGALPDLGMLLEAARDGSQAIFDRLVRCTAKQNITANHNLAAELDIFAACLLHDPALVAGHLRRDSQLARAQVPPANVNYRDFTPLHCCAMSSLGRQSPANETDLLKVAQLLIAAGADPNAQAFFYRQLVVTPLDMLAHAGGNLALSRFLIDHGAKITPFAFMEALCHRGRALDNGLALASQFLAAGFDINSQREDRAAIHAAANSGGAKIVAWLLQHGAAVNALGRMGRTPLHLAAERNTSTATVKLLVAGGADLHAKDELGLTPLEVALQHRKTAVAEWLKKATAGQS
jgi:ankyrin repeat protein